VFWVVKNGARSPSLARQASTKRSGRVLAPAFCRIGAPQDRGSSISRRIGEVYSLVNEVGQGCVSAIACTSAPSVTVEVKNAMTLSPLVVSSPM
jgi:hypothetical protein